MHATLGNIRQYFPILHQQVYKGKPLIYFDNAATTQKPQIVLDTLLNYYCTSNANVYRATHVLAERATAALERSRQSVQKFINATDKAEIIFTAGATASLNLVAATYGRQILKSHDVVIISEMEHHANIIPWQLICEEKGARIVVIPIDEQGELNLLAFEKLLEEKPIIVSITYVSNNLGTINPISTIVKKAHAAGAIVIVDAAQAAPHLPIDVQALDCDFLVFSGHKVYGPTGVGILYGKKHLLEAMPPYQGGGEMIREVTFLKSSYNDIPYKFEAGTPNIANIIALEAAINFVGDIGWEPLRIHEEALRYRLETGLIKIPNLKLIGQASHKVGISSFIISHWNHIDIGMLLDAQGIAVRVGYGCAQPLMTRLGVEGVVRVSLALYNTVEEVDYFLSKLRLMVG